MQLDKAGKFKAVAIGHEMKQASKTESVAVHVSWLVTHEWTTKPDAAGNLVTDWYPMPADETYADSDTWILTRDGSRSERAAETLREVFGWSGMFSDLAPNGAFKVSGKEAQLTAEEETYNGKTRVRVQWVNTVGASTGKTMTAADLAALDAKFNPGKTPTPVPEPSPEDIPF